MAIGVRSARIGMTYLGWNQILTHPQLRRNRILTYMDQISCNTLWVFQYTQPDNCKLVCVNGLGIGRSRRTCHRRDRCIYPVCRPNDCCIRNCPRILIVYNKLGDLLRSLFGRRTLQCQQLWRIWRSMHRNCTNCVGRLDVGGERKGSG